MLSRGSGLLGLSAVTLFAVTGCGSGATPPAPPSAAHSTAATADAGAGALPQVSASRSACGTGWTRAQAGLVQLDVHNTDINAAEVYLANAAGKVYAEVDPLGPAASAVLTASLPQGTYHLICSVNDADPVDGPTVRVTGPAPGGTGVLPVTSAQLAPIVIGYQHWVGGRLKVMQANARTLNTDLRRGDRAAARADLVTADHTWGTLGGAYEAFGDTGEAIDGNAYPWPQGVHDPHWTGLLRLEYGLWHGQSLASLTKYGNQLTKDLNTLETTLSSTEFDPLSVVLRSHEITEGSLNQTLTGHNDYGAHDELTEVRGQLAGSAELLRRLKPLVAPRYPGYAAVVKQLAKTRADVAAQTSWQVTTPDQPPSTGHELVDGDVAELTELLSPIPAMLEPRVF
ncbi:EfeM/EfeO family lipoprotein [Flexivirga caeni]|uniref:EfeM/EfeO family lipoprotein n=1 Tax=Flexivirga caeni TaxID=2294115 RepID=A0A3M9MEM9_9MICO|nr:EfeM/EfeO family lipoprotein [Flexivirga caeni]RNI23293.1 EfeM/EfeO family lipoprotein [Flexivirga caeni]